MVRVAWKEKKSNGPMADQGDSIIRHYRGRVLEVFDATNDMECTVWGLIT